MTTSRLLLLFLISIFFISCDKKKITPEENVEKKPFKSSPINHLNLIPIEASIKDKELKSKLTKVIIRLIAQNKKYELSIGDLSYTNKKLPVYQMKVSIEKIDSFYNITARIFDLINQVLIKKAVNKSVEYDTLIRNMNNIIARILATEKIMEND